MRFYRRTRLDDSPVAAMYGAMAAMLVGLFAPPAPTELEVAVLGSERVHLRQVIKFNLDNSATIYDKTRG